MTIQRAAASCTNTRAHIFKSFLQGERETAAKTHRAMKFETRGFCAFCCRARPAHTCEPRWCANKSSAPTAGRAPRRQRALGRRRAFPGSTRRRALVAGGARPPQTRATPRRRRRDANITTNLTQVYGICASSFKTRRLCPPCRGGPGRCSEQRRTGTRKLWQLRRGRR